MRREMPADILVRWAARARAEVHRPMRLLLDSRRLNRADRSDAVTARLSSVEVPQLVTVDTSGADLWHRLEWWDLGPGAHLLLTAGTGILYLPILSLEEELTLNCHEILVTQAGSSDMFPTFVAVFRGPSSVSDGRSGVGQIT